MEVIETRTCSWRYFSTGRTVWIAPITAIAAGIVAAAIYGIASMFGAIPKGVLVSSLEGKDPLTLGLVVTSSTIAATLAIGLFGSMERFSTQPIKRFRIFALVVLLASLASPFTIAGATSGMIATLLTMHVAVAGVIIGLLTTPASQR